MAWENSSVPRPARRRNALLATRRRSKLKKLGRRLTETAIGLVEQARPIKPFRTQF
jgi:hypothetical protein